MANGNMSDLCDRLDAVRRYARVVGRDAAHIDDLVQECLIRALSRPHLWREVRSARARLLTTLHDVHVGGVACRWGAVDAVSREPARSNASPRQVAPLLLRDLVAALQILPEHRRRVVLLTVLEGLSHQEVADLLDVPVGTVLSHLSRTRDLFGEAMDDGNPLTGTDDASGRRGLAGAT